MIITFISICISQTLTVHQFECDELADLLPQDLVATLDGEDHSLESQLKPTETQEFSEWTKFLAESGRPEPVRTKVDLFGNRTLSRRRNSLGFHQSMLNVVNGVTNKEVIPWFVHFVYNSRIPRHILQHVGITRRRPGRARNRERQSQFTFNLSGLGLKGHIDLGYLPSTIWRMDLSNNNLDGISLVGNGPYNVRELNLENNDNLQIDWLQIDPSSKSCCLCNVYRLSVSSAQLVSRFKQDVYHWLRASNIHLIVVDA